MKVAVDARELVGRPTGVGRYLGELLRRVESIRRRAAARLDALSRTRRSSVDRAVIRASTIVLAGAGGTRWEQWTLARALARNRPDVLFAPGYTAPLTAPCPVALTIHDVSFAAHPEWFSAREGMRRRALTPGRRAARASSSPISHSPAMRSCATSAFPPRRSG